jgi:hypothetical protein
MNMGGFPMPEDHGQNTRPDPVERIKPYQWKPGQSGNPGGRPKNESIVGVLRRLLEQEHNGKPIKELLAERILREALAGKFPYAKELLDRVEGRVTDAHEVRHKLDPARTLAQMSTEEKHALIRRAGLGHVLGDPGNNHGT